jgi:hypothetical protein
MMRMSDIFLDMHNLAIGLNPHSTTLMNDIIPPEEENNMEFAKIVDLEEKDDSVKLLSNVEVKMVGSGIQQEVEEVSEFSEEVLEVPEKVVGRKPPIILNTRHSSRL